MQQQFIRKSQSQHQNPPKISTDRYMMMMIRRTTIGRCATTWLSLLLLHVIVQLLTISVITTTTTTAVTAFTPTMSSERYHYPRQQQNGMRSPFRSFVSKTTSRMMMTDSKSSNDINDDTATSSSSTATSRNEIVARRIVVQGDVQGGYYRSCVLNEAGKFRRLVGTMSSLDTPSNDMAEIYVEGKLYLVEGFIRWCQRSNNIGLNQIITVRHVYIEEPTGLYDDFYAPQ